MVGVFQSLPSTGETESTDINYYICMVQHGKQHKLLK